MRATEIAVRLVRLGLTRLRERSLLVIQPPHGRRQRGGGVGLRSGSEKCHRASRTPRKEARATLPDGEVLPVNVLHEGRTIISRSESRRPVHEKG